MKRLFLALAMLLLTPALTWAFTVTVTGTEVTVTFTEPTANADTPPTPLTDLSHTNIYYQMAGSAVVQEPNIPATLATGGGTITDFVTVPVLAGQEADVLFWVTATDTSGNVSADSEVVVIRIDRLPPAAPN